jgi:ACS family D-galactonate transporter-like MFS transporter
MAAAKATMRSPAGSRRWMIAALLGLGVIVSYFDRAIVTAAAPAIQREFHLDDLTLGFLLGAFSWTYGTLQIPVGLLLDRFGVRRIMLASILLWAVASLATSMAIGVTTMFLARALLGIAEAPAFPANAKATGYWFPRSERSLATALFDGAAKFSNVVALPAIAFLTIKFGWREAFVITALLSLGYLVLFWSRYREPGNDPRLTPEERTYILQGGAAPEGRARSGEGGLLRYLLGFRKVWGLSLGFACYSYAFAFFISWLPAYLGREMDVDLLSSAGIAAIPWTFAAIANLLVGGWLIDHLVRKGIDETTVRKSVIVTGMVTALAVIGAAFTHDPRWVLIWITLSLSGLAAASPACWSLPSLIAPRGGAATIGGMMNFMASLTGIGAPMLTGLIVRQAHSFSGAFLLAGGMVALGIIFFTVVMGSVKPIPEPNDGPSTLAARRDSIPKNAAPRLRSAARPPARMR